MPPAAAATMTGRSAPAANAASANRIDEALARFVHWLDAYGESSYDFQTFYASKLGRKAKVLYYKRPALGTIAVAPMILCEAFVPSARRLFWIPQRFPIGDAHYAMAFAFRFNRTRDPIDYQRAVHFLDVLLTTRCQGYSGDCWGYPFDWEGITGTMTAGTPLITTVPYVYEAFRQVHAIDGLDRWHRVMQSIAEHALHDYRDFSTSDDAATCAYSPRSDDRGLVVNASAYRAFLLTQAAADLGDSRYAAVAERNLNFVVEAQNADGSWYYAVDQKRDFIDHYHTCFVLKALTKIERLTRNPRCTRAIERGVDYYISNLFDANGLPRPFSRRPRLTVYRKELYDYAECVNLGTLLRGRFPRLDRLVARAVDDLVQRWQKRDGSFRSRQLLFGWDNVPMHRWAQAQTFRSLAAYSLSDRLRS